MKKFLLASTSILAVAFASQAFAGGSSTNLSQTGNYQSATIDQTGANKGQVGAKSGNPFLQQDGAGSGGNVISIMQTGTENEVGATVLSWQSGTQNSANITQNGDKGSVTLQQTGNYNGSSSSTIFQGSKSSYDKVTLQQQGDFNQFSIWQDRWVNDPSASVYANTVKAVQSGSSNIVNSAQYGTQNEVDLTQWGNNNQFYSDQGFSNPRSYVSLAKAFQWNDGGGANLISSNQGGGSYHSLNVDLQYGHNNTIYNTQTRDYTALHVVVQSGSFLTIDSRQDGPGNTATVLSQTGNDNRITNRQNGNWSSTATFTQNGSNLLINNTQTGGSNQATFIQNASSSTIDSFQSATGNNLTATQAGYNSYANLLQTADNNTIVGSQNGYGAGAQNQAWVSQTSAGNTATYNQSGSGNYNSIKQ